MNKKFHYLAGILFSLFVGAHLTNHLVGLAGPEVHITFMETLRKVYRNPVVEFLLLVVVGGQILSGARLALVKWKTEKGKWALFQILTGLYLAIFLIIHVSAVLFGRLALQLDTNIYFAMAGLNTAGYRLFFFPYYFVAVFSFFGHLAAIHRFKMPYRVLSLSSQKQACLILAAGLSCATAILYAMTDGFGTASFPSAFNVLVGK